MDWSALGSVGLQVLQFLLPVLSSVLVIVMAALAKRWVDKLGIERSDKIDAMIDKYVAVGVKAAHKLSESKLTGEIKGNDKLNLATKTVLSELKQSGLKGVGEELIKARIEAYLLDQDPKKSK